MSEKENHHGSAVDTTLPISPPRKLSKDVAGLIEEQARWVKLKMKQEKAKDDSKPLAVRRILAKVTGRLTLSRTQLDAHGIQDAAP